MNEKKSESVKMKDKHGFSMTEKPVSGAVEKLPSLSIFFPAWNEEGNVERVTKNCVEAAKMYSKDYEVIIVDDGSKDKTGEIADKLAKIIPRVRAVHHETNKGYGAALQTGFKNAKKEFIFFTDGDGQFDVRELWKLITAIKNADVSIGYRINRKDPLKRKIIAGVYTNLIWVLFGLKVKDIDCAFKLYRKKVIDSIEMKSQAGFINPEMLVKAKKAGFRINQVGVTHYPRISGVQAGASIKVVLKTIKEIFQLGGSLSANKK